MVDSILNDLKHEFRSGHMITRLIIINIGIYMLTALIKAFAPTFYDNVLIEWIALPTSFMKFLTRPWTLFTHIFVHSGFWHVVWNLLIFHWLGRIVGDLIGDRHILPIYLLGGIAGAVSIFLAYQIMPGYMNANYAIGASAAILAVVMVAGLINPDHEIRLLLLGNVKIKFIVVAIIFFDLIGIGNQDNTGGHIAHLGGMILGWFYYKQLGPKIDLGHRVDNVLDKLMGLFYRQPKKKSSPLTVKYKSDKIKTMSDRRKESDNATDMQKKVDAILDKIKKSGYDSLTEIEKETLYKASKD